MNAKRPWVCVTGSSGDVGRGVVAGLLCCSDPPRILALDQLRGPIAIGVDRWLRVPSVSDESYVVAICEAVNTVNARLLFLGIDSEIPRMARARKFIRNETGCDVVVTHPAVVDQSVDKLHAANWLVGMGIASPRTKSNLEADVLIAALGLPIVAKPRIGHGSRGVVFLTRAEEVRKFCETDRAGYCFQEFVDGPEFTVGLLFDECGTLVDVLVLERRLQEGRTASAVVLKNTAIDAVVAKFAENSRATGPINLQLRLDKHGEASVFEVNPRLSGSTALRVAVGFNDPLRIYESRVLGRRMMPAQVSEGTIVSRVQDEVFATRPNDE